MATYLADAPDAAMAKFLEKHMPLTVARKLGVNNAHVYRWRKDGHVSPTLERALIKEGYVPAPPKRYRLHYECGRGESGRERDAQLRSEIAAAGCDSFTQFVDVLRTERLVRLGVCPDCGNDSCMADGVHGLWCPECDASYLLERRKDERR